MKLDKAQPHKRLLLCVQGVPKESLGASIVIFWHYISRLRELDFDILNFLFIEKDHFSEADLSDYLGKVAEPGKFEVVPFWRDSFYKPDWFSISLNEEAAGRARERGTSFRPDIIVCLDLLSTWIVSSVPCRAKIVWLGDLNFDTTWYHAWYGAKENPLQAWRLPRAWIMSRAWKRIYREVLKGVDSIIGSSKASEGRLQAMGISSVYHPYPWPDLSRAKGSLPVSPESVPSFLFFGHLAALGSRSALHFMLEELYPRLVSLWGRNGFQIFIAGKADLMPFARKALVAKPEFKYLGFVEDLEGLIGRCHAVIAPIAVPVGNRSRIVTALSMGALVIAHKSTALANSDLVHGETCFLAGSAEEFARWMRFAFEHPAEAARIKGSARQCYQSKFHPLAGSQPMVDEIHRLLARSEG